MLPKSAGCWALAVLLVGAGCAKKTTMPAEQPATIALVAVVSAVRRHFEAVNRHLELGGTLYIYADIDGDALKLATTVRNLADNIGAAQPAAATFLKQDYQKLFADLGLADIKALGVSSVPAATSGFRNRAFFMRPRGGMVCWPVSVELRRRSPIRKWPRRTSIFIARASSICRRCMPPLRP